MPQGMILIERSWNHLLDRAKIMRFCNRMRCPILAGCGSRSMRSRPAQLLSIRVVSHLGAQGLPCLQQPRPQDCLARYATIFLHVLNLPDLSDDLGCFRLADRDAKQAEICRRWFFKVIDFDNQTSCMREFPFQRRQRFRVVPWRPCHQDAQASD